MSGPQKWTKLIVHLLTICSNFLNKDTKHDMHTHLYEWFDFP